METTTLLALEKMKHIHNRADGYLLDKVVMD